MSGIKRKLLSGNEAVALSAADCGVRMGVGYPGTPSTEILEEFSKLGGRAQWSPNEKVALEVGVGAAFAGARTMVTMKHVGLNVAADPLFTAAYTGVDGALVIIVADDPGMASSQNEQDSRRYAVAAGVPMLEPADSQEAYDFFQLAVQLSEQFGTAVLFRITTRICHSKTIFTTGERVAPADAKKFVRDVQKRVMIPAYARMAHHKLRARLAEIEAWGEAADCNQIFHSTDKGQTLLGIIASGISAVHAREAASQADILKLGMTYPLPIEKIKKFAKNYDRVLVIEEGDPYLADAIQAAGVEVEGKPEMYRFGELNVTRVQKILAGDVGEEPAPPRGKPPQLCVGCPHRKVFETLRDLECIVSGDIGCYTLGVLPPFSAMDTCVCMGASIGVGLGLRHTLAEEDARRVVSVIGDSTFMHSGITGLVEMVYNRPATGHVVLILDNGTTAMTGLQEHPGTGRKLDYSPAHQICVEDLVKSLGIDDVHVIDVVKDTEGFQELLKKCLANDEPSVIIARRPCILALKKQKALQQGKEACQ